MKNCFGIYFSEYEDFYMKSIYIKEILMSCIYTDIVDNIKRILNFAIVHCYLSRTNKNNPALSRSISSKPLLEKEVLGIGVIIVQ